MSQNLVEMAREKAMKKHRPTEFRETQAQQPQRTREIVEYELANAEKKYNVSERDKKGAWMTAAAYKNQQRIQELQEELQAMGGGDDIVPPEEREIIPVPKLDAVGPAWTRGEIEKPEGERDIGGSTELYYTAEQQARLGVDEQGNKRKGRSGKALWKTARAKSLAVGRFKQGQKDEPAKPPAKVTNALEDAREKAAQKARQRDAVAGAPKETAPITTDKPLFGYFHPDGGFATGVRKGITGHPHGHIGNHFRSTRKRWFGFGGKRRRRRGRKSRRRKQRGGCGNGLCMSGGRRRKRRTRRKRRKKRKTRRRRGGFAEKCNHAFLFQNFNNKFQCTASKLLSPKEKFTCGIDGYCKNAKQAAAQHAAIKKYTGLSIW